jgi:hypothetical protein
MRRKKRFCQSPVERENVQKNIPCPDRDLRHVSEKGAVSNSSFYIQNPVSVFDIEYTQKEKMQVMR